MVLKEGTPAYNHPSIANTLKNIGVVYDYEFQDYKNAKLYYEKAVSVWAHFPHKADEMNKVRGWLERVTKKLSE